MDKRADACAVDRAGNTPLYVAALENNAKGIELLLECQVPVDITNGDKMTPLMATALHARIEAAAVLLAHGANAKLSAEYGTALHYLAPTTVNKQQAQRYIQLLKRFGATVNSTSAPHEVSPLHYCAMLGRTETAAAFLKESANVNQQDKTGEPPNK